MQQQIRALNQPADPPTFSNATLRVVWLAARTARWIGRRRKRLYRLIQKANTDGALLSRSLCLAFCCVFLVRSPENAAISLGEITQHNRIETRKCSVKLGGAFIPDYFQSKYQNRQNVLNNFCFQSNKI
jgi:hypothetical protein